MVHRKAGGYRLGTTAASGKHTCDEFPKSQPKTSPSVTSLRLPNVSKSPPSFTFMKMNSSFILNVINPQGKFPLKI